MCRKQRRTFLFSMQKVKLFSFIVQKMFLWNSRQYFALFHPDLCQFNPNSRLGSVKRCSEFNFSFNDRYSYFSYVFSIQNTYFLKVCVLDNTYLSFTICLLGKLFQLVRAFLHLPLAHAGFPNWYEIVCFVHLWNIVKPCYCAPVYNVNPLTV